MAQFQINNWELAGEGETSDIAVINTCGFIEAAKQESIDAILEAVALKQQGRLKKVVVMGCLSERYAGELKKEIPGVDAFIGANKMDQVVLELGGDLKYELLGERLLSTPQHFAYLKISEGCDRPCSFCSIPLMRGRHISKPLERVVAETARLAALGVKELVIIAQDSTYYGVDIYGKRALAQLLERISEVDGIEWIRLMYAFPSGFPTDILDQFVSNSKLCRYLDIPIQHISDPVLLAMRRGITSKDLRSLIGRVRATVPGIALRTTVLVGYPGETEKEFSELLDFVKEAEFERLGVFTYSQEDGTTAFPLGDPIPPEEKDERRDRIMEAQQEISLRHNLKKLNTTVRILADRREGDTIIGRTEHDAPEVDNEVVVSNTGDMRIGEFYPVTVVDAEEYDLFAQPAGTNGRCGEDRGDILPAISRRVAVS